MIVLDACSRRVVGWSIDTTSTRGAGDNALGMAIPSRKPTAGSLIHFDRENDCGLGGALT